MKWIFIFIALFFCFQSFDVFANKCDKCPANEPCKLIVPTGDKCNTCEIKVHCSDGYWYQGEKKCTFLDCTVLTPIEEPFENEEEVI